MTQDDVIRLATEAGVFVNELGQKDEREACAEIADKWFLGWPHPSGVIAEEIRQRGDE